MSLVLKNIIATIEVKLKSIGSQIPFIFALGSVMDPRMKLKNSEIFIKKLQRIYRLHILWL